jgi:N-acyl-D-amino-acid deacylase
MENNLARGSRGRIREGCYADIAVFDPVTVADTATFADPVRGPAGIRHVLVNGVPVVVDGRQTAARPGRILRGGLSA